MWSWCFPLVRFNPSGNPMRLTLVFLLGLAAMMRGEEPARWKMQYFYDEPDSSLEISDFKVSFSHARHGGRRDRREARCEAHVGVDDRRGSALVFSATERAWRITVFLERQSWLDDYQQGTLADGRVREKLAQAQSARRLGAGLFFGPGARLGCGHSEADLRDKERRRRLDGASGIEQGEIQ